MAKDAYYFSHDSNAKDDPKIESLIDQLGLEGYGIYWVLIEKLRDQPEHKYPLKSVPALARKYNTTAEKMRTVILSYELFEVDEDENFFSLSLLRRLESYENKKTQAKDAVNARWEKYRQNKLNAGSEAKEQKKEIDSVIKFYQDNFGPITQFIAEEIEYNRKDGFIDEVIIRAMQIALQNQKKWNYAKGVLSSWKNQNLFSVAQIEAQEKLKTTSKSYKNTSKDLESLHKEIYGE